MLDVLAGLFLSTTDAKPSHNAELSFAEKLPGIFPSTEKFWPNSSQDSSNPSGGISSPLTVTVPTVTTASDVLTSPIGTSTIS